MKKKPLLANLRKDYQKDSLDLFYLESTPIEQFRKWFYDARLEQQITEPNAMCLSTIDSSNRPSARIVLLKDLNEHGFVFFTNYESRKGQNLAMNSFAALTFWWPPLERQVRIEGRVSRISESESLAYFQSRPRKAQIGAWASPQSQKIPDREFLEKKEAESTLTFDGVDRLPLPPFWGGYCLEPDRVEFWQGRPSRLHDRFVYEKAESGDWQIDRLAP